MHKNSTKYWIFNKIYQTEKKISSGSFGVVFLGTNLQTNEQYALKLEKNNTEDEIVSVLREAKIIKRLSHLEGIPKIFWFGSENNYDVMVLTLLGKDLGSYIKIFKKFSLKTITLIAIQLISRLEKIHENSVLHRDLKPENILMGKCEYDENIVYIVDFGISKYFKDCKGRHIPLRDKKSFIGTTRYASISAHLGIETSRKDDLESLGYVLIYFFKG